MINFKKFYRNLKIKRKLFLLLLFEVVIITSLSFAVLQIVFKIYNESLYEKSEEVLNLSSYIVDGNLGNVERLSFNILSDPKVQEDLDAINNSGSNYTRSMAAIELKKELTQMSMPEKYAYSVTFIDMKGGQYTSQFNPSYLDQAAAGQAIISARAAKGANVWLKLSAKDGYVASAREILSTLNMKLNPLGTLIIRSDPKNLIDSPLNSSKTYKDSMFTILSGDAEIFSTDHSINLTKAGLNFSGDQGYTFLKSNGKRYFVAYTTSGSTGWKFVNVLPYDSIFISFITMNNIVMLLIILMSVVVIILGLEFARGITRPIINLTAAMKKVENGDFEIDAIPEVKNGSEDEIAHLNHAFGIMIGKINTLIQEDYIKQILVKDAQLKALQAQINPHFLYNTLDSINWLAKAKKQPEIATMAQSLGSLLRSSISNKEYLITIGQEISLLNSYITIQKTRYEERLDFSLDIPEELYQYRIPKLSLQPVVENSINYGLEVLTKVCSIKITAERHDEYLLICIADNGPGITEDLLIKLRNGEVKSRGTGIGLKNIDERIRNIFGEKYGVSIESKLGEGTVVSLVIPYETEGRDV